VSKGWIPAAGDLIKLDFDPQSGHEQAGYRPGLVVSPASYNGKLGLALICPITSQVKGYPFEVLIPSTSKLTGVVLSDQIKCLDWKSRKAKFVEAAPATVLEKVRQHLKLILEVK